MTLALVLIALLATLVAAWAWWIGRRGALPEGAVLAIVLAAALVASALVVAVLS